MAIAGIREYATLFCCNTIMEIGVISAKSMTNRDAL